MTVWFTTYGAKPSEITRKLERLGFKPVKGNYDYEYEWSKNIDINEILETGDRIQDALKGCNVLFKLETV